jgi:flagellar protein FlaF
VRSDRGAEYAAFEAVTARLSEAAKPDARMPQKAAALHDNRRLWTVLATDLASDDNALPQSLRAQLFYLAEFSLLHGSKVLREAASVEPLIEINRAIMQGLDGRTATA